MDQSPITPPQQNRSPGLASHTQQQPVKPRLRNPLSYPNSFRRLHPPAPFNNVIFSPKASRSLHPSIHSYTQYLPNTPPNITPTQNQTLTHLPTNKIITISPLVFVAYEYEHLFPTKRTQLRRGEECPRSAIISLGGRLRFLFFWGWD